ncbi:MAG TPA: hypothetical protein DIC64_05005 [Alphaproteobacteria bacterium]|nr:hypothetical protein [Alphaproteobacteria bacterium]
MVEMLGVLAIIGVLSAGALAGYSKAMFRHRVNQTIDIFQGVLQRFAELEQKGIGQGAEIFGADNIIEYGLMKNCQKFNDEEYYGGESCKLQIGRFDADFKDSTEGYVEGEFYIRFSDSKSCMAFLSAGWENAVPLDWWNPHGAIVRTNPYKTIYDPNGAYGEAITKVEMGKMTEACQQCDDENGCQFMLVVHQEF